MEAVGGYLGGGAEGGGGSGGEEGGGGFAGWFGRWKGGLGALDGWEGMRSGGWRGVPLLCAPRVVGMLKEVGTVLGEQTSRKTRWSWQLEKAAKLVG